MNSILNFIVWNPDPDLFSIFGFSIRYYSVLWALGLGLAYYIVKYLYKDQNIPEKQFEPLFFYCFFGVLIGARLGHCLFYEPMQYLTSLSGIIEMIAPIKFTPDGIKFTGYQGLASHGGTIGLMIALYLYMRKTGVNLFTVLDNIALAVPLTAFCIRLGNFFNSEIIGKPTGSDMGVVFAQVDNIPRHPAQFYEAMAYLAFFIIGFIIYKKFKGKLHKGFFFGYCLITIFTFRFFIEFLKENQVAFEENMTLDMGQWLSIPFILIGIASIVFGKRIDKLSFNKGNSVSPKKNKK